ncbi:hypothetical protein GCM10022252_36150 [Streptosporangium oxazolinicum]|uniref:Uncharacterized protein n=1 Tax=Streptosporangium oxazolinicum TaxID=909287 RepID=A0ABP8AYL3_9ACTN
MDTSTGRAAFWKVLLAGEEWSVRLAAPALAANARDFRALRLSGDRSLPPR